MKYEKFTAAFLWQRLATDREVCYLDLKKKKIRNLPPEVRVRRVGKVSKTNMSVQYNVQRKEKVL